MRQCFKSLSIAFVVGLITIVFCCQCSAQFSTASISPKAFTQHGLKPQVMEKALKAHAKAVQERALARPHIMTVIDYSKPANEKRLWVINLQTKKMVYHTYVAHGKNTGQVHAKKFSNKHGSHQSSLGVFRTGSTYHGKHGNSLDLHGLEPNFNSNAYKRRVVMHGAGYVSDSSAKKVTKVGRSHGCPALSHKDAKKVIPYNKGGSLMFAYYPDASWLKQSSYIA